MGRHRGLSQAAISPGDWVHLKVSAAAYRRATLRPAVGEKHFSVSFEHLLFFADRSKLPPDNQGCYFFRVGWLSIPLGCSFIIPTTNSHFTHPWFFWMYDALTLTPKTWGLLKDALTQANEKALTVIYNFGGWHDSRMLKVGGRRGPKRGASGANNSLYCNNVPVEALLAIHAYAMYIIKQI